MKKLYNEPVIEIENTNIDDVICASGTFGGDNSWKNDDVFDWTY